MSKSPFRLLFFLAVSVVILNPLFLTYSFPPRNDNSSPHGSSYRKRLPQDSLSQDSFSEIRNNLNPHNQRNSSYGNYPSFYETTGLDSLRPFFHHRLNFKNRHNEKNVHEFTLALESVKVDIDTSSNTIRIQVHHDNRITYLQGFLDLNRTATILPNVQTQMGATFICLDQIEIYCFNFYIELQDSKRNQAVVGILGQKANADFRIHGSNEENFSLNDDPRILRSSPIHQYFFNTASLRKISTAFRSIVVETLEILNGKSHLQVALVAHDGQVIYLQSPLFHPHYLKNPHSQETLDILLSLNYELDDLKAFESKVGSFKTDLAHSLESVTLLRYESDKKVTLSFSTKNSSQLNHYNQNHQNQPSPYNEKSVQAFLPALVVDLVRQNSSVKSPVDLEKHLVTLETRRSF
jgi:hypothetical protein